MATQALVSSSSICSSADAARQILGGRSIRFFKKGFLCCKGCFHSSCQARSKQTAVVCVQAEFVLFGWKPSGDYGFDPLGLSDPEGTGGFIEPRWLAYGEIINGRFAMLGAAGAIAPEILGKAGLIPAETALPAPEIPRLGNPGPWEAVLLGPGKGVGRIRGPGLPGGPFFNPLGFGKMRIIEGIEVEGSEEWKIGHVGSLGLLHTGTGYRRRPVPKPIGSFG
ncbi:UNVERIFIED_CONTAM: Chlorophyll a-b binding protein 8, chloroplastic [Sesamum radiatum]|uniref:Chlorophyll a-b binding protein, chloroplastic n=1 Tax=Sesamum radiatum TaxID=300843 RepID=A0AAW2KI74_SESRA